ncbi:unnamed protein product [Rotaria sordida]|uniref:RNA-dependent RNA polymerase n=1 Tax=Rotaria sordida TaxID=392033 RepID=A0A819J3P5_9BILA|nr:unnamed protein product [Rotaria sordida]CAF0937572.1 unnamed protein product [Rotaria sordida]CAF0953277.1 unnamed protein product [Rotaria sordida]CAF1074348.1 unnamed protein product [Rotaria sordida]CAF1260235.1 unnamed protein product [Rotaria sordida]
MYSSRFINIKILLKYLGSIHLNRQVIALLESRHIPHSTFLLLQNQHLLSLVESLLYLPSTYELLHERLPPHLQLRDLILTAQIDLIHEPFFRQLITTMCKYEVKRIQTNDVVFDSIKSHEDARIALCNELASYKKQNKPRLNNQQFEMIANLLNYTLEASSSINEHNIAYMMLTLATIFHRIKFVMETNTNITRTIQLKKDMITLLKEEIDVLYVDQEKHNDRLKELYSLKQKEETAKKT